MTFYQDIFNQILSKQIHTKEQLHKTKVRLCKKYRLNSIPSDSDILTQLPKTYTAKEKQHITSLLRKKPMRTISGVAIVAVMTSPASCPHGQCVPCPGGPLHNTPQSYTGYEPAAMRASLNHYDPYEQTRSRLDQLQAIGHDISKIDLIVMGGTFTARTPHYQTWFIKRCYDALNNKPSMTLSQAKEINETAASRCIGLTIETRPDWLRLQHLDNILQYGATRVELGVQTIYDTILTTIKRGHTVHDTIHATTRAKESGFKVCYHIMPGLPGSNNAQDIECIKNIFQNPGFKPDMLKIYPTLTIKETELYHQWQNNTYKPLSSTEAAKLIAQMKQYIPPWVRIQRIQRDVPAQHIAAGVTKSNLRQLVTKELEKQKIQCNCIRCREIGHKSLQKPSNMPKETDIRLFTTSYQASNSTELFLSYEDPIHRYLIAYLRLRQLNNPHRSELINKKAMIIRELKVLGRELPLGDQNQESWQHKGYGRHLINHAERLCFDKYDNKYLFVLSGIGVKEYYRNLGFKDTGIYLSKSKK